MKFAFFLILFSVNLQGAELQTPVSLSISASVEEHFQTARKLYLNGDRSAALNELGQALSQDPDHPGSTNLYKTIHAEESRLRQLKLLTPVVTPALVSKPSVSSVPQTKLLLRNLLDLERRSDTRYGEFKEVTAKIDTQANVLQAEMSEQREGLLRLSASMKSIEYRQNGLLGGLLALFIILLIISILLLRMLFKLTPKNKKCN